MSRIFERPQEPVPFVHRERFVPETNGSCRRILFACWDFRIGGVGSYTINQARAFRRRGHVVGAIVPEPFGQLYPDFVANLNYVEIVRRGWEPRRAYLRRLASRIAAWHPDVLINSAVPMVQAVLPYLPAELIRISMVHSIMGLETDIALANGEWVDWVVAVSDGARSRVEQDNRGGVQCVTIPVGLELPDTERRQKQAACPLRLIYVGRISPEKNLFGLLQILAGLREAAVPFLMTIVGDGPEFGPVYRQAQRLRLGDQVRFLGMRPPAEVSGLLDGHDFLLLTSHFEGTPHVALEAMAHGLVVVAPLLPGSTDRIITDGEDGFLCKSRDPEEYVGILERFSREPGRFGPLSSAAQKTAATRYSLDVLCTHYEPMLQAEPVRQGMSVRNWQGTVDVPAGLKTNFPGFVLQCKHRASDLGKAIFCRRKPVAAAFPGRAEAGSL